MGETMTTMTKKGQVTIPAEVRKLLGVKPKDKVSFRIEHGEVKLARAASTLEAAYGAVQPLKRPEDFEGLVRAAKDEHAGRAVKKP